MRQPVSSTTKSLPAPAARRAALSDGAIDPELIRLVPRQLAERYGVVPVTRENGSLSLAMSNPSDILAIDEIGKLTGCRVVPVAASREEIAQAIVRLYAGEMTAEAVEAPTAEDEEPTNVVVLGGSQRETAPAILLLNQVLEQAISQHVTDVHIEPHDKRSVVRFRIDGVMYDWMNLRPEHHPSIMSRIKVLAHMNIAERRLPLDGRFAVRVMPDRQFDVRVSTVPGVFGEKAVLRLLPKGARGMDLENLGLSEGNLSLFEEMIAKPHGMVLVTGPTGSGKTTTLYAALRRIDVVGKNAITVEDPVEYELPRVTQIQVHPKIGLTFAQGLRSILRQDPDIIMVGEIRDAETLAMAVQAALTGHLVFSTLHCNDAAGAAARCIDMGLEPFLLTSSVIAIVAQRLVRRICTHCKAPYQPSEAEIAQFNLPEGTTLYRGQGCPRCRNLGYSGRMAVFEALRMTERIKALIHKKESASTIRRAAIEEGMISLQQDAARKVLAGLTTPEEVLRGVYLEE
jgi:type IV pilus assembly protein PilB